MICTAVGIIVTGIRFQQSFFRIFPLFVSLLIAMLQSRVNRYACLFGSFNSLLYGVVYVYYNLYGSALSAVFFSFPIQFVTFIRWNKNKWGDSTMLKKLSLKQRILILVGFAVALISLRFVLISLGSRYVFLDSATNLLGILIYILTMFAYVEYTILMLINGVISISLYISMLGETPEMTTYLVFAIYSMICTIFAVFNAKKLYNRQQLEKEVDYYNVT
jgi:nicotinamide mononucleotide transporter PnuC